MCFLIVLASCNNELKTEKDFYGWLNDPENGFVKTKIINDIKIIAKYLPLEYLAFKELRSYGQYSKDVRDSILALYNKSRTFLLTIGPYEEKGAKFDIMKTGVHDYTEFKQRAMTMNFDMAAYVSLNTELGEFKPVLTNMENVYGLSKHRNIYLVFTSAEANGKLMTANELDLTFTDEIFNTGINHFIFKKEKLDHLPTINFWKI